MGNTSLGRSAGQPHQPVFGPETTKALRRVNRRAILAVTGARREALALLNGADAFEEVGETARAQTYRRKASNLRGSNELLRMDPAPGWLHAGHPDFRGDPNGDPPKQRFARKPAKPRSWELPVTRWFPLVKSPPDPEVPAPTTFLRDEDAPEWLEHVVALELNPPYWADRCVIVGQVLLRCTAPTQEAIRAWASERDQAFARELRLLTQDRTRHLLDYEEEGEIGFRGAEEIDALHALLQAIGEPVVPLQEQREARRVARAQYAEFAD